MSGENPFVALTLVATLFGTAIVQLATSVPSPGEPGFPGIMVVFGAVTGAAWHWLTTRSREGLQERAFVFSMVAGSIAMVVYLACLAVSLL
jgi:hypothetical protein